MEAVARLLSEREVAFRIKLRDYNDVQQIEPVQNMKNSSFRLYEMNVLGMANGAYEVRVLFSPVTGKSSTSGTVDVVVFVTIEGEDFEIVGYKRL